MRICILLSTFNGARFLEEQVTSVLEQSHRDIVLYIRDDGSKDETVALLQRIRRDSRVMVEFGPNVGVVASFFELLRTAPLSSAYAFCDQDDKWHPKKLERAVEFLKGSTSVPAAVHSRLVVTDEALRPKYSTSPPPLGYSFGNALVQNVLTGCGLVINQEARRLLVERWPRLAAVRMHDWWAYLLLSAVGEISYDDNVGVWYRQHGGNEIGAGNGVDLVVRRVRRFFLKRKRGALREQAEEFYRCFSDLLCERDRQLLENFLRLSKADGLLNRLSVLRSTSIHRQSKVDTAIFRALLFAGYL